MTKRFILMGGLIYYASGGFNDFISSHETKDEAETAREAWIADGHESGCWTQIADLETGDFWNYGKACNPMGVFL